MKKIVFLTLLTISAISCEMGFTSKHVVVEEHELYEYQCHNCGFHWNDFADENVFSFDMYGTAVRECPECKSACTSVVGLVE